MTAPRVVALVGPTGAGKSAVALAVAQQLDAEIVALDAFTVYRGMDVGTAKPTRAERALVAHHLIDVLDPAEECTVRWFQGAARAAIAGILARGRLPLLVGGSGLYFRAVVDPLEFPPTDAAIRADLLARYQAAPAAAHAALRDIDPAAAARMDPANLRRAVRALEVIQLTDRAFSDWRRAWDSYESCYAGLEVIGLQTDREELAVLIGRRVEHMVAAGLIDEVRALAAGPLSRSARQAIGYAEMLEHLAGRLPLAEASERTRNRTRRYAARQRRWFNADPRVGWAPAQDVERVLTG